MSGSIPVVCLEDESFKDILIDNINGKYFKNEDEYVEVIEYLIQNPDIRKKMCDQAEITSEMHSLKFFAKRVLDVYKEALGMNKKGFFGRLKDALKGNKDE